MADNHGSALFWALMSVQVRTRELRDSARTFCRDSPLGYSNMKVTAGFEADLMHQPPL